MAEEDQLAALGFAPIERAKKLQELGFEPAPVSDTLKPPEAIPEAAGDSQPLDRHETLTPAREDLDPRRVEEALGDPGVLRTVARTLSLPGRGFRGLGVLIERALRDKDLSAAMQRASEATEPGFEAREGEGIGATAGKLVGDTPLFAAIASVVGPLAAALRLGPAAAAAVEAGTAVGGAEVVDQIAEKGALQARDVAIPAVLGMLLGAGASKASQAVRGLVDDAAKLSPEAERALAAIDDSGALVAAKRQPKGATPPGLSVRGASPEPPPSGPAPEVHAARRPLEPKAGNIALAKLNTSDDARRVIQEAETEFAGMMAEQRKGRIPWETTEENAALLGLTPERMAKIPGGRASSAESLEAQKAILVKSAQEVAALREAAAADNSTENLVKFMLAFRRHATLQRIHSGQVAEAGRALGILRKSTDPAEIETQNLKGLLDALGGRELTEDLLRRLSTIDPKDTFALSRFIREAGEASAVDQLYEAWINSILSSPLTHKVNTLSNALFAASRIPERLLRAGIDAAAGAFTGQRTAFAGEAAADLIGMVRGVEEGVRRGLHVLRHGVTRAQATKLDAKTFEAIKGPLGSVVRLPTKFLTAEDEFFKAVTGVGERSALAYRTAAREGLKGQDLLRRMAELEANPTPEMRAVVREEELYRTFQTQLGKAGSKLLSLRDEAPLLRWVVPFIRTPANIAKRSLERTPLNAFNIAYKALRREGPYAQEEAVKDAANLTIGSLIAASAAYYAAIGKVTGRAPKKPAEKDAFYRTGRQPYSLKIGDAWHSYDRLEPWSMSMGLVADAVQEARELGPGAEPSPEAVARALAVFPQNLTSKTFLSGISDAFDAISDPERYGDRWISRFAGGFVPFSGALRFAAQVTDATIRKPATFQQAMMVNLPVLSELVPARRNVFGEAVTRPNDVFSLAIVRKTKEAHTLLEDELQALDVAIGFPGNRINGNRLTQEQYEGYLVESGKRIKERLTDLVEQPGWKTLDDAQKRRAIDRVVSESRREGRSLLIQKHPALGSKAR